MKIPGRARCICFLDNYIHNAKTVKFNRDDYNYVSGKYLSSALSIRYAENLTPEKCEIAPIDKSTFLITISGKMKI